MNVSNRLRLAGVAIVVALTAVSSSNTTKAAIVFDDFNVDEGHFNLAPSFSGSNSNIAATSTADRTTADNFEGGGHEQIVLNMTTAGSATRLRFLSGSGTPANNVSFTTSSGTDGWIGLAVKTSSSGWTVQPWLEGQENNGGVPKGLTPDGAWHIYEWNLDDQSGGPDGWGAVAGIVAGDADFENGSYTLDSVLFRHTIAPATATFDMDFVAKSDSGSIADLVPVPEPGSAGLLGLVGVALGSARRRRPRR
jgi:hypothetical protein